MKQSLIMAIVMGAIAPIQSAYAKAIPPQLPQSIDTMPATKFFRIPGVVNLVHKDLPIYSGSNFTWGEATRDGSRIPRDTWYDGELVTGAEIAKNIEILARELDEIREQFGGNPITINSWYRPPSVNASTPGAAELSPHLIGLAADIVIYNHGSFRVYDRLNKAGWPGGLGRYVGRTHVDLRHLIGMPAARWDG